MIRQDGFLAEDVMMFRSDKNKNALFCRHRQRKKDARSWRQREMKMLRDSVEEDQDEAVEAQLTF